MLVFDIPAVDQSSYMIPVSGTIDDIKSRIIQDMWERGHYVRCHWFQLQLLAGPFVPRGRFLPWFVKLSETPGSLTFRFVWRWKPNGPGALPRVSTSFRTHCYARSM